MPRFFIFFIFAFVLIGGPGCTHKVIHKTTSETPRIEAVLTQYIDGTSKGRPDLLRQAFHPDFNLYARNQDDTLRIWNGQEYIGLFKSGESNNRIGRIISIDQEGDVATAKVEIEIPGRLFTDYFLLVKYAGQWKIIHKSYTSRAIEKDPA